MPFPDINDAKKRKDSHARSYLLAVLVGVGMFAVIYLSLKILGIAVTLIISYWGWIFAGVIALIFIKKFLSKKRVIMEKPKE